MKQTTFKQLAIGQRFFDCDNSGEWMVKVANDAAEFIGHPIFARVSPSDNVQIEEESQIDKLERISRQMNTQAALNECIASAYTLDLTGL